MTEAASVPARENFPLAVVAGIAAAIVGAAVWAGVTIATQMELGAIAIVVGFVVGYAIRVTGHGRSRKFGILGAVCGLLGCLLGNLLTAMAIYSEQANLPFLQVATHSSPDFLFALMKQFTQAFDFIFYAIAVYEGYRFSFDR